MHRLFRPLSLALGVALAAAASAQTEKPVRIIVGFPAGATLDSLARQIADKLRAGPESAGDRGEPHRRLRPSRG